MASPINPADIVAPASRYAQGVVHAAAARRLVISGQIGLRPDGRLVEGLEAQMVQAWENLLGVVRAAGMDVTDLVKVTTFVTVPGSVGLYRSVRDRMLGGHLAAATYLEIAGLAHPGFLVEIEGEAVREGP